MKARDIIRSAQCRAGYFRQTERLCRMVSIPLSTFNYKLKHGGFTAEELKRLDMALHFTDSECGQLIRGK